MGTLLFLIAAFMFQEVVSANAALYMAYRAGFDPFFIHALFLLLTSADILIGYWIGTWIQRRFTEARLVRMSHRLAERVERVGGVFGQRLALALLGIFGFPYIDGIVISWMRLPLRDAFFSVLVGATIWYATQWALVLGALSITPHSFNALWGVLALSVAAAFIVRFVSKKFFGRF